MKKIIKKEDIGIGRHRGENEERNKGGKREYGRRERWRGRKDRNTRQIRMKKKEKR